MEQVTEPPIQNWDLLAPTLIITRNSTIWALAEQMCYLGPKEYARCVYSGPGGLPFATQKQSNWPFMHIWLDHLIELQSLPDAKGVTVILNLEFYRWSPLLFDVMERYKELQVRVIVFATDDSQLTSAIHYGERNIQCTTLATDERSIRGMEWRQTCYEKQVNQLYIKQMAVPPQPRRYAEWRGIDIPQIEDGARLLPYIFTKIK